MAIAVGQSTDNQQAQAQKVLTATQDAGFSNGNSAISQGQQEGALWILFYVLQVRAQWAAMSTQSLANQINSTNNQLSINKAMENTVNAAVANLPGDNPSATTPLPKNVYEYLKNNDIPIEGANGPQSIDDFLGKDPSKPLNSGQLNVVKNSIELNGTKLQNSNTNLNFEAQKLTNIMTTLMNILTQILETLKQIILKIISNM